MDKQQRAWFAYISFAILLQRYAVVYNNSLSALSEINKVALMNVRS